MARIVAWVPSFKVLTISATDTFALDGTEQWSDGTARFFSVGFLSGRGHHEWGLSNISQRSQRRGRKYHIIWLGLLRRSMRC